ncbi:MAG: hypothetical protein E6K81_16280 [Candidatus Eisenbacteria bacterium]|uniref:Uncharacterized protein n=1 Tax=Eiseniibacteriota bacterium TaxID=2212470 RepID=A0A538TYW0_UNCEI|nr:MAG: hypothetical protein E6K81_16280 [Candidatus Eisenbacteria bacterium]
MIGASWAPLGVLPVRSAVTICSTVQLPMPVESGVRLRACTTPHGPTQPRSLPDRRRVVSGCP